MLPAEFGAKAIRNLPYRLQRPRRHSHIFLSYRHEDTVGYTGRLHEDLARIFGAMNVFKDSSSIPPGAPFPKYIETELAKTTVLVAVIGKQWLSLRNEQVRRIDEPSDFVREEIRIALERGLPVIPVLVQGASMPRREELPQAIAQLAEYQAIEVSDTRWDYDVGRLASAIARSLNLWKAAAVAAIILGSMALATWLYTGTSLPGSYRCTSGDVTMPGCVIEKSAGSGLQITFYGPTHEAGKLVDAYHGEIAAAHCGFSALIVNDFSSTGVKPYQEFSSQLKVSCAGKRLLKGTWSMADGNARPFQMERISQP